MRPSEPVAPYYAARKNEWCALSLLEGLSPLSFTWSPARRRECEPILWDSVATEYDSQNLFQHLRARRLGTTRAFESFLGAWLRDEINHARGFVRIYSLLYDESEEEVLRRLRERTPDFSAIEEFFDDELSLSLLLAYDEIVTTHVYERSAAFYASMGPPELSQWIQLLKADEALHFSNLVRLIRHVYPHRVSEVDRILDRIVSIDRRGVAYGATFVLDHGRPEFPLTEDEVASHCVGAILRKVTEGLQ